MELKDIAPKQVAFTLKPGDQEIDLTFRPFVQLDEVHYQRNNITGAKLQVIFEDFLNGKNQAEFYKLVFHQLATDSKKIVVKAKYTDIDPETGDEIEVNLTPIEKLMAIVGGFNDQFELYKAFLECRGLSMPVLKEIAKEELKKKGKSKAPLKSTG